MVRTRFNASTPLEQQVAALLAGSKAVIQPGEELSEIEKKGLEGIFAVVFVVVVVLVFVIPVLLLFLLLFL